MKEDARVKNALKRKEEFDEKVAQGRSEKSRSVFKKLAEYVEKDNQKEDGERRAKRGAEKLQMEESDSGEVRRRKMESTRGISPNNDFRSGGNARGTKRSGEDIEELEEQSGQADVCGIGPHFIGNPAVRERWADLEDSEEDEQFDWRRRWQATKMKKP